MGGEAGILAILTAPLAILLLLGGPIAALVVIARSKPSTGKLWALGKFLLISIVVVPALAYACLGLVFITAGVVWQSLLMFPSIGLGVGGGSILSAFIATGKIKLRTTRKQIETPKGQQQG